MNSSNAKLVVLEGKLKGRVIELTGPTTIGRHAGATIRLPDVKISREHSKLFKQGEAWAVVDLNSRNGTLVNDAPITKRILRDGDEIHLGSTRFRFESPAPAEESGVSASAVKGKQAVREVVDLSGSRPSTPVGAIRADEIKVKEKALQFSKNKRQKKVNPLFDDIGQRNFVYQLLMILVVVGAGIVFLVIGLYLGGVIGAK